MRLLVMDEILKIYKMQSLVVIACKLLRVIFAIFKNGTHYDPKKMLRDIRRQTGTGMPAAA